VKPPVLRYARPASLEEALDVLAASPGAKCLAGGQSLIPLLNLRLADSMTLVDLARVPSLDLVERRNGHLVIGALTRHRTLETSPEIRAAEPLLARAAREVGHLAIRNRGTIGGSLAHADPAAEWPLVATALDARVVLRSARGSREVSARALFTGPLTTAIGPDEILTEVHVPVAAQPARFGFQELCRRPGDFAIVAVACRISLDERGICRGATLAVGGAHGTPLWISGAERALAGSRGEESAIGAAADVAARAVDPGNDVHASADYRRRMTRVLACRALRDAFATNERAS
jgi:aerobic carbon-monoxide dehydrogenase medium subunit